jgi:hypothetical protein
MWPALPVEDIGEPQCGAGNAAPPLSEGSAVEQMMESVSHAPARALSDQIGSI